MKKNHPTELRKPCLPVNHKPTTLRRTFIMLNRNGLHARPCALLINALLKFKCTVDVEHDGAATAGRSIMGLMCLAVGYESKVTFVMNGTDASQAMAAVQQLFDTQFEEAYRPGNNLVVERW